MKNSPAWRLRAITLLLAVPLAFAGAITPAMASLIGPTLSPTNPGQAAARVVVPSTENQPSVAQMNATLTLLPVLPSGTEKAVISVRLVKGTSPGVIVTELLQVGERLAVTTFVGSLATESALPAKMEAQQRLNAVMEGPEVVITDVTGTVIHRQTMQSSSASADQDGFDCVFCRFTKVATFVAEQAACAAGSTVITSAGAAGGSAGGPAGTAIGTAAGVAGSIAYCEVMEDGFEDTADYVCQENPCAPDAEPECFGTTAGRITDKIYAASYTIECTAPVQVMVARLGIAYGNIETFDTGPQPVNTVEQQCGRMDAHAVATCTWPRGMVTQPGYCYQAIGNFYWYYKDNLRGEGSSFDSYNPLVFATSRSCRSSAEVHCDLPTVCQTPPPATIEDVPDLNESVASAGATLLGTVDGSADAIADAAEQNQDAVADIFTVVDPVVAEAIDAVPSLPSESEVLDAAEGAVAQVTALAEMAQELAEPVVADALETAGETVDSLPTQQEVLDAAEGAVAQVTALAETAQQLAEPVVADARETAGETVDRLPTQQEVLEAADAAVAQVTALAEMAQQLAEPVVEDVVDRVESAVNSVPTQEEIAAAAQAAIGQVEGLRDVAVALAEPLVDRGVELAEGALNDLPTQQEIVDAVEGTVQPVVDRGFELAEGALNDLPTQQEIVDAVEGTVQPIVDRGVELSEGALNDLPTQQEISQAIENAVEQYEPTVNDLVALIQQEVAGVIEQGPERLEYLQALADQLVDQYGPTVYDLVDVVQQEVQEIVDGAPATIDELRDRAEQLVDQYGPVVQALVDEAVEQAANLIDAAPGTINDAVDRYGPTVYALADLVMQEAQAIIADAPNQIEGVRAAAERLAEQVAPPPDELADDVLNAAMEILGDAPALAQAALDLVELYREIVIAIVNEYISLG